MHQGYATIPRASKLQSINADEKQPALRMTRRKAQAAPQRQGMQMNRTNNNVNANTNNNNNNNNNNSNANTNNNNNNSNANTNNNNNNNKNNANTNNNNNNNNNINNNNNNNINNSNENNNNNNNGPPRPVIGAGASVTRRPTTTPIAQYVAGASVTQRPTSSPTPGPTWLSDPKPISPVQSYSQIPMLEPHLTLPTTIAAETVIWDDFITYQPGKLTHMEAGLNLSAGLTARVIALSGQPVVYRDGSNSTESFHRRPDAGACFEGKQTLPYRALFNRLQQNYV
jgi:hypothetical protein